MKKSLNVLPQKLSRADEQEETVEHHRPKQKNNDFFSTSNIQDTPKTFKNQLLEKAIEIQETKINNFQDWLYTDCFQDVYSKSMLYKIRNEINQKGFQDVSVVVVDIDNMKKVNDFNQSHTAGTHAIQKVVETLKQALQKYPESILVRPDQASYIVTILPEMKQTQANKIARFVQAQIEKTGFMLNANQRYPLTVSAGTCSLHRTSFSLEDFIQMVHTAHVTLKSARAKAGINALDAYQKDTLVVPKFEEKQKIFPHQLLNHMGILEKGMIQCKHMHLKGTSAYLEKLSELKQILNKIAHQDEITGLFRRTSIYNFPEKNQILQKLISNANQKQLSLAIVDVDNVGKMNARYGPVGDKVTRLVADKVKAICAKTDIIYAHAGDEIIIISPFSDEEKIKQLSEKIRKGVREIVFDLDGTKPISVSVGTRTTTMNVQNEKGLVSLLERMIDDADKGLYKAKENGKNRVFSFEEVKLEKEQERMQRKASYRDVAMMGI